MRAIRTEEYLYIRNVDPERWPAGTPNHTRSLVANSWLADVDNGPTKCYMSDIRNRDELHRRLYDLSFGKRPAEELYVIADDPGQMVNVADDPDYSRIKSELAAKLSAELRASGDPRMFDNGFVFDSPEYLHHGPDWPQGCMPR